MMRIIPWFFIAFSFCLPSYSFGTSLISRPSTVPQGELEAGIRFNDYFLGSLRFKYGITDDFQMSLGWNGFSARGLVPEQKLTLGGNYYFHLGTKHSGQLYVNMPVFFQGSVVREVNAGVETRWQLIADKLEVVLLEEFLNLQWSNDVVATFRFPLKIGFQATDNIYAYLSTQLGAVDSKGFGTYLGDTIPVFVGAHYSPVQHVDIFGSCGFRDAKKYTDFSLMLGVGFRGELF